jgi:hypothetical protein
MGVARQSYVSSRRCAPPSDRRARAFANANQIAGAEAFVEEFVVTVALAIRAAQAAGAKTLAG